MTDKPLFSLNRRDRKIAGVASGLGHRFGIDPTFVRIGFVAAALLVSWEVALITYVGLGIYMSLSKRRRENGRTLSDYARMGEVGKVRPSVHALRTELDATDRRMIAIDNHLASPNHELAREIDALKDDKDA